MQKRASYISLFLTLFLSYGVSAQSRVDSGISTHNYKHPQKAAKARALDADRNEVVVPSIGSIERYSRHLAPVKKSYTPKYKPRTVTLVTNTTSNFNNSSRNALVSKRNYKTNFHGKNSANVEVADLKEENINYPTVD